MMQLYDNEIIRDIIGYEIYFQITNYGRIWSKRTNKFLKPNKVGIGYLAIVTRLNGRKSKSVVLEIHKMVALTFIPNPDNKPYVNHIDGNKENNFVNNLEWCTPKENSRHAVNTGLITNFNSNQWQGENHPKAKVTNAQVIEIREALKNNPFKNKSEFIRFYSKKYNMSFDGIKAIVNNRNFKFLN